MGMRWGAACLLAAAALGVGCGGGGEDARVLRSGSDVGAFIDDVVGGNAAKWKLGADATLTAQLAWNHQQALAALSSRLEKLPEWGCDVAERLEQVGGVTDIQQPLDQQLRSQLIGEEQQQMNAPPDDVGSLLDQLHTFSHLEVVEVAAKVCGAAKQL